MVTTGIPYTGIDCKAGVFPAELLSVVLSLQAPAQSGPAGSDCVLRFPKRAE